MEPTILYKLATPSEGNSHRGPKGRYYKYLGVKTEDELSFALKNGWHEDLEEAVGLKEPKKPAKKTVRKKFGEE